MPTFQWITYLQTRQALAARLADPNNQFWTDQENGLYIIEALRTWNALTEIWNAQFAFTATNAGTWYNLSTMANSPRLRTVTDVNLYTMMEYHLLEPPTGATWTGTSQFSIGDLSGALQRRRDEMIQESGCNIQLIPNLPSTPNSRRTVFSDSTLEPRRARFIPDSTYGNPVTLTREDTLAWDYFEPNRLQTSQFPQAWSVITGPPLAMDVDTAPNAPGYYEVISLQAGPQFNPPNEPPGATLLGVPDDWSWLAKWGALADLLGRESEATDRQRAQYCIGRYMQGLEIMKASNWLVGATLNGIPVDTPSLRELDGFSPEWQNNASAWPAVVSAGMDFVGVCPIPVTISGVTVNVVGNAPIPILDGDYVQVSRDVLDVILDYAQVLAAFKQGGADFASTKGLEMNFFNFALAQNKRLSKMGLFSDMVHSEGKRQDLNQPR
jgi:hypothetical protein